MGAKTKPRRKYSHAQARNLMRRAVNEILDPCPTSIDPLWEWFESRCAYCDVDLARDGRRAHTDHAEPAGGNHTGNLILSCATCNGDEKRDMHWRAFLELKATDPSTFAERERRILGWMTANTRPELVYGPEVEAIRERCEALIEEFRVACNALQDAVKRPGQAPVGRGGAVAKRVWKEGSPEAAVVAARRSLQSPSWVNIKKGVRSLVGVEHEPFETVNVRNSSRSHVHRIARDTGLSLAELLEIFDNISEPDSPPGAPH